MESAFASPISNQVLLQELNHRIGNEFFSAMSLVSVAAARSRSNEAKATLRSVTELLHHYAEVHQALTLPEHDARVDAVAYLRKICLAIKRSKLDHENRSRICGFSPGTPLSAVLVGGDDSL
jgi:two-component sensor histidine kinase